MITIPLAFGRRMPYILDMEKEMNMNIEVVTNEELIYWAGREAGEEGRDHEENPYQEGTEEYDAWLAGWDDAIGETW